MMNISRFNYLFKKYTEGNCMPDERNEFFEMVVDDAYAVVLNDLIKEYINSSDPIIQINKERSAKMFDRIDNATFENEKVVADNPVKKRWIKWRAAAAIIFLILLSSSYFIFHKARPEEVVKTQPASEKTNDIAPGHAGAILTLSNGKKIVLDNAQNGLLASQGKSNILKKDGQLVYKDQNSEENEVLYNTMTTPKGRKYQLVLSDGSKVWLDAASSITFPTTFNSGERKVEITGEAYFEIKKLYKSKNNSGKEERVPFIVVINSGHGVKNQVQVLGTHFNIMAYNNEPTIKTTLLEGSVKVIGQEQSVMIKPGEQAVLSNTNNKVNVIDADVDEAVAWKNGMFSFSNATIGKVMRQVERWYDVEVIYNGPMPDGHYRGEVPMNVNASEMLKVLSVGGIHFKIEGKKIIVAK